MKKRLLSMSGFWLVLLLLAPAAVWGITQALPPFGTPLPQPDLMVYGRALQNQTLLSQGVVEALLPRGALLPAAIGEVPGTPYTYILKVLHSSYDPEVTAYQPGSVVAGDLIRFTINGIAARVRDGAGNMSDTLAVPARAQGESFVVDLILAGPEQLAPGDVDANGLRDGDDARLILDYDAGLPGPTLLADLTFRLYGELEPARAAMQIRTAEIFDLDGASQPWEMTASPVYTRYLPWVPHGVQIPVPQSLPAGPDPVVDLPHAEQSNRVYFPIFAK